MQEVASRLQLWRHRRTQPTAVRRKAEKGGQRDHVDSYLSSLAEKGRNAAAMLPVSQTSSSKRRRIRQGMHALALMDKRQESMRSSLNHGGMHPFGSASETVASCADSVLSSQYYRRAEEIRSKGAVRGESARKLAHTLRRAFRRLSTRLTHLSAVKPAKELLGWCGRYRLWAVMACAVVPADLCMPCLGTMACLGLEAGRFERLQPSLCTCHMRCITSRRVQIEKQICAQPDVEHPCRLAESSLHDGMAMFPWPGVSQTGLLQIIRRGFGR